MNLRSILGHREKERHGIAIILLLSIMLVGLWMFENIDRVHILQGKFTSLKIFTYLTISKNRKFEFKFELEFYLYRSSAGTSPNEGYLASSYGSAPQSLPTFHHPSHALLKENGFTQQVYHKYHSRCLKGKYKFLFIIFIFL